MTLGEEHGATPDASSGSRAAPSVTVLFFAQLRRSAGTDRLDVALQPGTTVADLATRLQGERPGLILRGCLCAVDEAYAEPDRVLRGAEVVAFLPPVSGG